MGTSMNFNGLGNDGNFSLVRQPSVYSLTFDEFQSTVGKDFGSMNMEELLKSIWSAEETQNTAASAPTNTSIVKGSNGVQDWGNQGGFLQRQGSLTLPRTLSLETVDHVWKDIAKDYTSGVAEAIVTQAQREPTLGEITLEEFLVRVGVVREDTPLVQTNGNRSLGFGIDFEQPQIRLQPPVLPLNVNGVRSSQPLFPKQSAVSCAPSMTIPNSNGNLGDSIFGYGCGGSKSPTSLSSDGLKSSDDAPSVLQVPFMFNGDLRGRRSNNTVEKVIERRHMRMIKNRESAARSRARKQAYTMELEQEVAKLREENKELRKKQAEVLEMQKDKVMEIMSAQHGAKKRRLMRTSTVQW